MTVADSQNLDGAELVIEDVTTGSHASGFGLLGDGRAFSFRVHRGVLALEIYRRRRSGPVPLPEDVVVAADRDLSDFDGLDLDDEAAVIAAVRQAVAAAVGAHQR